MASNALTSTGGGVGWQVDLPGLSSLLLNLGSAGLKRFAEAGVDFHTILCFGEIAEVCPASIEYRKQLSICRQEQRKESQWFYKVIEIGSATNFVADELLKKRAGENVVALMSSILPVMPESTCDNLLLKLFEASSAPLDKTPGFGQLRSLRETLCPLARKTDFKDRAFQYHILAKHLLQDNDLEAPISASIALPSEETAVQVIILLARLLQEETGCILEYRGLKGAGWVIAYARHILGLPVCILKSSSDAVPISGDYLNSKVFVYIFENANECQIVRQGVARDLFLIRHLENSEDNGWMVDVSKTNVLDIHISKSDPIRRVASSIAYSILHDFTQSIAECLCYGNEKVHVSEFGLSPYSQYCLPAIRCRAMKSLELLGFDAPATENSTETDHWSKYFDVWRGMIKPYGHVTRADLEPHLAAGPAWIKHGLGHTTSCELHHSAGKGDPKESRLTQKALRHVKFLICIVEAVSWLACTDWQHNLRMLSTSFVEDLDTWKSGFHLYENYLNKGYQTIFEHFAPISVGGLVGIAIDLVIGGRKTWTPNFISGNLLAFHHKSIVFKSSAALNQSLDVEASMLHLLPGAIYANGEKHDKVFAHPEEGGDTRLYTTPRGAETRSFQPANRFPSLNISTRIRIYDQGIFLEQHAVVGNEIFPTPNPVSAFGSLIDLFVTEPCEHDYYEPMKTSRTGPVAARTSYLRTFNNKTDARPQSSGPFSMSDMQQGLCVSDQWSKKSSRRVLWFQEVDQNPLGQWLAHQTYDRRDHLTVLQRHCCLGCTCDRIERIINDESEASFQRLRGRVQVIRIVTGRLAGEAME